MSNTDFVLGEAVRVSVVFTDENGAAKDPDTLKYEHLDPDDTLTEYVYGTDVALVRDGVGLYHVDVACEIVGRWKAYYYTEGDYIAAGDTVWHVRDKKTSA